MNIFHLFSILIIVSGSICPAFALDTSKTCDANTLPHYGPHNQSHIYITDTNGNLPYIPLTYHTTILHDDDVWNTYPDPRTVQVTLTIQNHDTGQLVFNQTQSLQMHACSGPESVKWRFVPIQVANYIATVSDDRGKEGMIFNSMLDATKSQTVSSPLEQLKSGLGIGLITCKSGFYFVLGHDREPLCLKAETISNLASRGFLFATSTSDDNHTTVIISPGSENPSSPNTYSPGVESVVLGVNNTVRWVNQADVANTIVPDMPLIQNGKSFGSDGVIKPDQSYSFTFTEPGTFPYHTEPHPWMKGTVIVLSQINNAYSQTSSDENTTLNAPENNCTQFQTVPQDNRFYGSETYPILILKQNSIGCAKITYSINYMYNDNRSGSVWPQMLNLTELFHIGKYLYTSSGTSFGMSSIDTMQMFKTQSIPEIVDLGKYSVGSQFTVTSIIKPLPNATGFYDYSIPEIPCVSYPLVVGYSIDQVNSNNFSKGMITMHNHSCANLPYQITSVQVSGMDLKLVKFS